MTLTEMARHLESRDVEPNATARDFFDALDNAKEFAADLAALEDHIESDGLPTLLPGMKEEILGLLHPDHDTRDQEGKEELPITPGMLRTADAALTFILAGNAYFTVRSKKTGTRFTYRIARPKKARENNEDFWYVSLLNGPDNEHNYTYMANLKRGGLYAHDRKLIFWQTQKCQVGPNAASTKAIQWTLNMLEAGKLPDALEIWHEGRCGRCGRKLTVPESIAAGIGPECAGRMS